MKKEKRESIETPEWMRKLFDREEEFGVVGEDITVIMLLLRVARAADDLVRSLLSPAEPTNLAKSSAAAFVFAQELKQALEEVKDIL